jgi:hypothetical protein
MPLLDAVSAEMRKFLLQVGLNPATHLTPNPSPTRTHVREATASGAGEGLLSRVFER